MDDLKRWSAAAHTSGHLRVVSGSGDWPDEIEGIVITPHGMVEVVSYWLRHGPEYVGIPRWEQGFALRAVVGGRLHGAHGRRPRARALGKRGLTTLARRWAMQIAEESREP